MIHPNEYRLVLLTLTLTSLAACDGCSPGAEDPEVVFQTVDELLEGGDPGAALSLLERHELIDTDPGLLFAVEAWIMSGEYELAQQALTTRVDLDADTVVLLEDACAMGALAAIDAGDPVTASARLEPCSGRDRVDLFAISARLSDADVDLRGYDRMIEQVRGAEDGPELDTAAAQLEQMFLERAETEEDVVLEVALRRRAYVVGQDPEIGDALIERIFQAAEEVIGTDRQQSATFLEILYLRQVEGLEVSDEVVARATERATEVLFPIYTGNLWDRYERKFSEEDVALGLFDLETRTFNVGMIDTDERLDEVLTWYFRRIERPRPHPTPDIFTNVGVCINRTVACSYSFERHAAMAYDMNNLEERYLAENPGVTFEWTPHL